MAGEIGRTTVLYEFYLKCLCRLLSQPVQVSEIQDILSLAAQGFGVK